MVNGYACPMKLSVPLLNVDTVPTPIQLQAIPAVLADGDLLAGAQTGAGKIAGFTLPILHRLSDKSVKGLSSGRPPIRALILVPTRELAAQVKESVREYGKYLKLSSMIMIGGANINPQITHLKSRVDILVATPGRMLDHVQQKTLSLSQVEILMLDEADQHAGYEIYPQYYKGTRVIAQAAAEFIILGHFLG
jgi:ATP-dependent RNA helicase RhlE